MKFNKRIIKSLRVIARKKWLIVCLVTLPTVFLMTIPTAMLMSLVFNNALLSLIIQSLFKPNLMIFWMAFWLIVTFCGTMLLVRRRGLNWNPKLIFENSLDIVVGVFLIISPILFSPVTYYIMMYSFSSCIYVGTEFLSIAYVMSIMAMILGVVILIFEPKILKSYKNESSRKKLRNASLIVVILMAMTFLIFISVSSGRSALDVGILYASISPGIFYFASVITLLLVSLKAKRKVKKNISGK